MGRVGDAPASYSASPVSTGGRLYLANEGFLTGFSPRKDSLTLYLMPGLDAHTALLAKLGKHKTSKSCLYIKTLRDVDPVVLKRLVGDAVKVAKKTSVAASGR